MGTPMVPNATVASRRVATAGVLNAAARRIVEGAAAAERPAESDRCRFACGCISDRSADLTRVGHAVVDCEG